MKSIASEIIQAVKGHAVGFPGNCLLSAAIIISLIQHCLPLTGSVAVALVFEREYEVFAAYIRSKESPLTLGCQFKAKLINFCMRRSFAERNPSKRGFFEFRYR